MLVEDEKLSWDDTIRAHLSDFQPVEDSEIGREATLVDACRRSTGLANPNAVFMGPGSKSSTTGEQHVSMVNALPTFNSSGQRFRNWWYCSNAVFGLMGQVGEAASDTQYFDSLRSRMLKPLGMEQTLLGKEDVDENCNIAQPYVQMTGGEWSRIPSDVTSERYTALLASMGIRSSVNDMLAFFSGVMNSYDEEEKIEPRKTLQQQSSWNPLRQISSVWNHWWTRPMDDSFEKETAYLSGWYRTTMPSGALGLTSYDFHRYTADDKPYVKYIIGQQSPPRTMYGHNGITNGSVSTAYLFPDSNFAVVVLSNAANAGDAAESTAQVLLQALFDLKPHIDLLPSVVDARDRCLKAHDNMIAFGSAIVISSDIPGLQPTM